VIRGNHVDPGAAPTCFWRHRRDSIGFVFQQFNLFPRRSTAAENVAYSLNIKGKKGAAARVEAERWLVAVGAFRSVEASAPRDPLRRPRSNGSPSPRALAGGAPHHPWPTSRPAISTSMPANTFSTCSATLARGEGRAALDRDPTTRRSAGSPTEFVAIRDGPTPCARDLTHVTLHVGLAGSSSRSRGCSACVVALGLSFQFSRANGRERGLNVRSTSPRSPAGPLQRGTGSSPKDGSYHRPGSRKSTVGKASSAVSSRACRSVPRAG